MIELTPAQVQAIDCEKQPARAVDPSTGQVYRLVKNEVYEIMNGYLKPLGGPGMTRRMTISYRSDHEQRAEKRLTDAIPSE